VAGLVYWRLFSGTSGGNNELEVIEVTGGE